MAPQPATPSYADQSNWQELQQFLPEKYRLTTENLPTESWWNWRNERIHLDRYQNPSSPVRVILLHGVGTNGRQMSLILGRSLAAAGIETVAPDNLGYGLTRPVKPRSITYDDWVQLVVDFVAAEQNSDSRPIILYGLSAGGMLAYHAAAAGAHVSGIIGMTFLDQSEQRTRDETSRNLFMSRVGLPFAVLANRLGFGGLRIPMRLASKMSTLVNNHAALKVTYQDKSSAGNAVPIRFLDSMMNYTPAVTPENFTGCPILLTQPEIDRWTPLYLSESFLDRIVHVPVTKEILPNGSHLPIEEPALDALTAASLEFIRSL